MDTPEDIAADLSPLEQRRAALRALSDDIMETIKDFPKPQSWLEGDRAMRCLGTADRVTVQLFSKVRAHTSPQRNTAPPAPEPEAPFVYTYDDDGVEDGEETDSGKALDAALDDMEALLDAIDRGETPAPGKRPQLPAAKAPATNGRNTSYQDLAQHLSRGRDLLMELAAVPP
ncbi:hypothetical protein [Asticcacaulis sp.]|uniref:hypothetical protein n=1 Tax=Asticcacaulis sp. TaxID=1872648 RepID=UPI002C7D406B|nr:hypothetical protein [Asticcacaulis sp.]HTM80451.1 hypothetical protein [Asticcacaulis sp.]